MVEGVTDAVGARRDRADVLDQGVADVVQAASVAAVSCEYAYKVVDVALIEFFFLFGSINRLMIILLSIYSTSLRLITSYAIALAYVINVILSNDSI